MKKYSYQGTQLFNIAFSQYYGCMGILIFTVFALFLLSGIPIVGNSGSISILDDPRITLVCLAIWFLLIAWFLGGMFINFLPTIWMTEQGLQISAFIFLRVQILWSEIVNIGAGMPPEGYVLVRCRKITPFHRVYGWFYSQTFYPSFLIEKDISDRDELIHEIRRRIK